MLFCTGRTVGVVLCMLVVFSACSSLSRGRRGNGPDETARLLLRDHHGPDRIAKIDGQPVKGRSYKLWPGRHKVEITTSGTLCPGGCSTSWGSLGAALPWIMALPLLAVASLAGDDAEEGEPFTVRSPAIATCFIARPGRTYQSRISYQLGTWKLVIFDHATTYDVSSPCKAPP